MSRNYRTVGNGRRYAGLRAGRTCHSHQHRYQRNAPACPAIDSSGATTPTKQAFVLLRNAPRSVRYCYYGTGTSSHASGCGPHASHTHPHSHPSKDRGTIFPPKIDILYGGIFFVWAALAAGCPAGYGPGRTSARAGGLRRCCCGFNRPAPAKTRNNINYARFAHF